MSTTLPLPHEQPQAAGGDVWRTCRRVWGRIVFHRAAVIALTMVGTVFTVDLLLPLGVASAVPYTFAVLVALKARLRSFAIYVAVLCCLLTIAKMVLSPERGSTELWKVYVNRGLAVFSISITTFLGLQRRKADDERDRAEENTRRHLADLAHMGRLKTAGQLATSLAHELNQPLTAISLQAEIATQLLESPTRAELQASLREITDQAQCAAGIMRTLRGLVQKAKPNRAPVDLNDIVREVVRLIDAQAQRAGVKIELALAVDLPAVEGDRIQLGQVLLNLLQNAIDAKVEARPGEVEVRTRLDANQIAVVVADRGAGLTDAERVFERFYTTKPTGMGMGLAISRSIAEAHGGKLWAEANPPGGAVFTLVLPLASKEVP